MNEERLRCLCLTGPTGTGKSKLALQLARAWNSVIINADSRQLYKDFPIITAQPSQEDRAACPHELYGFLETEAACSAGQWAELAMERIRALNQEGKVPLLVGGTGFYLRALFHGIVAIPPVPYDITAQFDTLFQEKGGISLHERLTSIDPAYAAKIHPNDRQRIVRALSVHQATGHSFSWWHTHTPPPPDIDAFQAAFSVNLNALEPHLAARIAAMIESGAIDEARAAKEKCSDPNAPGWSGIGCAELYKYLEGSLSLEQACQLWQKNTRAYAKRQITWLKAEPALQWFRPEQAESLLQKAETWYHHA